MQILVDRRCAVRPGLTVRLGCKSQRFYLILYLNVFSSIHVHNDMSFATGECVRHFGANVLAKRASLFGSSAMICETAAVRRKPGRPN